jgi:deoxyribonuclease V
MDSDAFDHAWDVTPKEAVEIQRGLRERVRLVPLAKEPKIVAGADLSLNLYSTTVFAGFTVLSYPDLIPKGHSVTVGTAAFPYVPGLLSFREIPALLAAWNKLRQKPDLIMVDGVGYAHPRRLGIATHLGLVLNLPTIGCAKSVLTGIYGEPGAAVGSVSYMYDPKNEEIIGAAVRTKLGVKPMFISAGHLITLDESVKIVLATVRVHRMPEPTRLAHLLVNEYRKAAAPP